MKILLLGVGLQGRAALYDLAHSPDVAHVIAADADISTLRAFSESLPTDRVSATRVDVRDEARVAKLMQKAQAVIALLPHTFCAPIARQAIECGIHYVDASYPDPTYKKLAPKAVASGAAILPEMGLDPGIDLLLARQAVSELDVVTRLDSYGGGIPISEAADNPLRYKISWTFAGVLRSYADRAARLIVSGAPVDIPPRALFSEAHRHTVTVPTLGELEAYPNGDATQYLKALGIDDSVQHAGRYSLRWPGHCAFWDKLVNLGFLDETPVEVETATVSPRQFVHDLLHPQLEYDPDERDAVVVRVEAHGLKAADSRRVTYEMVDRRDTKTGLLAMQRTVGFTASIGAQLLLRGDIRARGLLSPVCDVPAQLFFSELSNRGISVQRRVAHPSADT